MKAEDRRKLRQLAERATPGPWHTDAAGGGYGTIAGVEILFAEGCIGDTGASTCGEDEDLANAAYIAAAHPGEIIELLDALEKAEIRVMLADIYTPAETETWLTNPHPQLEGVSAADAIRAGRFEEVVAIIERINDGVYL